VPQLSSVLAYLYLDYSSKNFQNKVTEVLGRISAVAGSLVVRLCIMMAFHWHTTSECGCLSYLWWQITVSKDNCVGYFEGGKMS